MAKIRQAKEQFICRKLGGYREFIAREAHARWQVLPNWEIAPGAPPLTAFICRSDWVWICECGEQVIAQEDEPAWCPNCCNAAFNGLARPVVFPDKKAKDDIEKVLLKRIYPENRNWLPGEPLEQLEQENREHPGKVLKSRAAQGAPREV